jgi:acyl transferase domain-containing protein
LDSAASFGLTAPRSIPLGLPLEQRQNPRKSLLLFSANHPESLKAITQNYESYLEKHADSINDLAYTLAQLLNKLGRQKSHVERYELIAVLSRKCCEEQFQALLSVDFSLSYQVIVDRHISS